MFVELLANFFNIFKTETHIYTDGSHKGKWGSWAFVVVQNNRIIYEASQRVNKTNSNRMEFQAAIEALTYLKPNTKACIFSDSRVLIKAVAAKENRPEANADQIEVIDELLLSRDITWKWIKAHSGIKYNERCDELCISAREGLPKIHR
ncbi:ribonuclease HI [bacterium]|nr:ribonuclease HI [bacterium]